MDLTLELINKLIDSGELTQDLLNEVHDIMKTYLSEQEPKGKLAAHLRTYEEPTQSTQQNSEDPTPHQSQKSGSDWSDEEFFKNIPSSLLGAQDGDSLHDPIDDDEFFNNIPNEQLGHDVANLGEQHGDSSHDPIDDDEFFNNIPNSQIDEDVANFELQDSMDDDVFLENISDTPLSPLPATPPRSPELQVEDSMDDDVFL